jgi:hypothetical protein
VECSGTVASPPIRDQAAPPLPRAFAKAPGTSVGASRQLSRDLSEVPAAQQLWHLAKAHLLELFKESFWRRAEVQPATLAALRTGYGRAVPVKATPIFEGKTAIVPRLELPWQVEPEERPVMTVPVAEVMMVELRDMTEPEHEIAVAELEYQPALPEVPEVPRLEVWDTSELECEAAVAEMPEVP